jgi:Flp pilus assembly protein TadG
MKPRFDERGALGGLEGLVFGVLIFVCGTLVVVYGWAVINAKIAATSAAREASRAYVEAGTQGSAVDHAQEAAYETLSSYISVDSPNSASVAVDGGWSRCQPVVVTVTVNVRRIAIPMLGREGGYTQVSGRHSEIVDPYRSAAGLAGAASCLPS